MKSCARWLVCGIVVMGLVLVVGGTSVADTQKHLTQATRLSPPHEGSESVDFKANTTVTLDAKGFVISGTLDKETRLNVAHPGNDHINTDFMGGTWVKFDERGYLTEGTLSRTTRLNLPPSDNRSLDFKAGTAVRFDSQGYVVMGTLDRDERLVKIDGESAEFKAGTTLEFGKKGRVVTGSTIPVPTTKPAPAGIANAPAAAGIVNDTSWRVNNHPVPWVFHANGTVEAPGLWKGTWTKSGDGYNVTLTHQGATDSFTVKFNPDGRTFTAFKGGSTYRNGVRIK